MLTGLLAVLPAAATVPPAPDSCAAEAKQFCAGADGDVALVECLYGREKDLTPECRAQISALRVIAKDYGKDCVADAKRLCADAPRGEGGLARCLQDNMSNLSQSCQGAVNRARLLYSEIQASCADEFARLCPGIPEGSGRILACLREHDKELSSVCRDVVKKLP
jgi:hypothetical protein